jgi:hypothetical protein
MVVVVADKGINVSQDDYELLEEVNKLQPHELIAYAAKRAERIVSNTQGESWDDPEEWQMDAVELAHAVYRLKEIGRSASGK